MFSKLPIFQTASALAGYATTRQSAISQNMANADTPGYRAQDLPEFSETFKDYGPSLEMRTTREKHFSAIENRFSTNLREVVRPGNAAPNGNSVSMETEMMTAAENKISHDMALTVYRSSLTLLRTALGGKG